METNAGARAVGGYPIRGHSARLQWRWINERVAARYQRVSGVVVLPDFPRSAAGKTLKRELREPYWAATGRKV